MTDAFSQRPPRVTLTNVETAESISAQFNPEQVTEQLGVNYSELEVLGLSHKPMQYRQTENLDLNFDLRFDALSGVGSWIGFDGGVAGVLLMRAFLHSLCYPRAGAGDVASGSPPRVLFSWPNLYAIVVRVTKLKIEIPRFRNRGLHATLLLATLQVREHRESRLTSEDANNFGTIRAR